MAKFQIWTRRFNDGDWTLYGEFKSDREFQGELPNIRFLGLYVRRVNIR